MYSDSSRRRRRWRRRRESQLQGRVRVPSPHALALPGNDSTQEMMQSPPLPEECSHNSCSCPDARLQLTATEPEITPPPKNYHFTNASPMHAVTMTTTTTTWMKSKKYSPHHTWTTITCTSPWLPGQQRPATATRRSRTSTNSFLAPLILLWLCTTLFVGVIAVGVAAQDDANADGGSSTGIIGDEMFDSSSSGRPSGARSSAPDNAYFVTGLANTIRKLNATLLARQSTLEPFQMEFRTACWFGNLITSDRYVIGIDSANGNLSHTRLNDQRRISRQTTHPAHVGDGMWHTLLFEDGKVHLVTKHVFETEAGAPSNRVFLFDLRQLPPKLQGLTFFDGFVGCVKLSYARSGASIPYSTRTSGATMPRDRVLPPTITDFFQFGPSSLYQLCLDPHEDLAELYASCPHPSTFVYCADCRNGGRCEVTNVNYNYDGGSQEATSSATSSELDLPTNQCVCSQDSPLYTGKYCDQLISAVDAVNNLTTILDAANSDAIQELLLSQTQDNLAATLSPLASSSVIPEDEVPEGGEVERVMKAESTVRPMNAGRAASRSDNLVGTGEGGAAGGTEGDLSTTTAAPVSSGGGSSSPQADSPPSSEPNQSTAAPIPPTNSNFTSAIVSSSSAKSAVCPCQHGGVCLSSAAASTEDSSTVAPVCSCEGTGYYGQICEIENTFCHNSPCAHGICQPKADTYQCYCLPGYAGEHCDIDFNECLSSPCANGATCLDEVNKFQCECAPGFKGIRCETEIDECESDPCFNGGVCHDALANYTCECQPGFSGHSCEIDIDECASSPCKNNATCTDLVNAFRCDCTDTGFEGFYCDREIDECAGNPCVNNGSCVDGFKNYTCMCPAGYAGPLCELDIPECEERPCVNNGTCYERSDQSLYNNPDSGNLPDVFHGTFSYSTAAGYECVCVPGFSGKNCEIDIDECADNPCAPATGKCIDGTNSFTCQCVAGYEGTLCETEINECASNPCERGQCIDKLADYACACPEGYGAKNCSVELIGCSNVNCFNGGTCIPSYVKDKHDFTCACPAGFAGNLCQAVTTLSFNGAGYAEILTDDENYRRRYSMSFRFRTTLSEVLIAIGQGSTYFMLELSQGRVNLQSSLLNSLRGISSGSNVSNAEWHHVSVFINETHIALAVNMEQTIHPIQTEPEQPVETGFNTTVIGGAPPTLSTLTTRPFFVGCIQDIAINEKRIIPGNMEDEATVKIDQNVVAIGCKRQEQCAPNPCENSGACVDLWQKYECKCPRPYLGSRCEAQYVAATFGHENTTLSIAAVHIPVDIGRKFEKSFEISMFVRTREPRGTIFLLTDKRKENPLFIKAYVEEDGQLGVLAKLDESKEETYKVGGLAINDGEPHLISFQKEKGLVKINVNGTEHFRKSLPVKPTTLFNPDTMYIGGIPEVASAFSATTTNGSGAASSSETSTSTSTTTTGGGGGSSSSGSPSSSSPPTSSSEDSSAVGGDGATVIPGVSTITSFGLPVNTRTRRQTTAAATTTQPNPLEPFKGVIQDVRVNFSEAPGHFPSATSSTTVNNKYVVEFFPITQVNSTYLMGDSLGQVQLIGQVMKGVVSDDACYLNPCLNDGRCQITWNDFVCICPEIHGNPQFDGKTCNHLLPCAIVSCPTGSMCRNVQQGDGFECRSEVAFDGKGKVSSPHYRLRSVAGIDNLTFNEISFRYRSQRGGSIFHIDDGRDQSLKISIEPGATVISTSGSTTTAGGSTTSDTPPGPTPKSNLVIYVNGNRTSERASKALDGNWHSIALSLDPESSTFVLSFDGATKSALIAARTAAAAAAAAAVESGTGNVNGHGGNNGNGVGTGSNGNGANGVQPGSPSIIREGLAALVVAPDFIKSIVTSPTAQITLGSFIRSGASNSYSMESHGGGSSGDHDHVLHSESFHTDFYRGCLDEVYIGPYRLPFVTPSQLLEINPENQTIVETTAPVAFYIEEDEHVTLAYQQRRQRLELGCVLCYDKECQNGGKCENAVETFDCSCRTGFNGSLCEINIDECEQNFCTNGSTCIDQIANYTCNCPPGYTGWLCDTEIDECDSSPCLNGGICQDGIAQFTCTCPGDYIGDNCEKRKLSSCKDAPCENGANCVNTPEQLDGTYFNCICPGGFTGKTCAKMIDFCENITCINGGTCRRKSTGLGAECLCAAGWDGPRCEKDINECAADPCKNGGKCADLLNRFECDCQGTGFEGTRCDQDIDECNQYQYHRSLCQYNATCINTIGSYTCRCQDNYCGLECNVPNPCNEFDENPCGNGECECADDIPWYRCECRPGFRGTYCNETGLDEQQQAGSFNVVYVIAPILAIILIGLIIATIMLVRVAKKKRATRGVYSPSQQEYCNPRVELDNVLKPPPEERLI